MSKGVTGKFKINGFEDIIGEIGDGVTEIELSELHDFENHPFRVLDDEKMEETVESIKEHGVLMPGIVRPRKKGGYEIIAGHRRKHACELAGLTKMPVFVRDYSDDEATVIMVDTNIQRDDILPSEKARAYEMKYIALKHQGKKGGNSALDDMAETAGESAKTIQRYIWLARLNEMLLEAVDAKKLSFVCGVDISFLGEKEQFWVQEAVDKKITITTAQSSQLKEYYKRGELNEVLVRHILAEEKPKAKKVSIKAEKLSKFFDDNVSAEEIESIILEALEEYMTKR